MDMEGRQERCDGMSLDFLKLVGGKHKANGLAAIRSDSELLTGCIMVLLCFRFPP